ncbi:hypothetical protein ACFPYI_18630 [Halomarina salina]|uniref:Uncharacterized protein n=1 Tax=Halomarina salina TaxID=1872699 RepID=A0ABD5RSA0_9EURY|nr:hypothetical protein [Halomarina salina]
MTHQKIVHCTTCGQVYAARKREDGTFILSTADGRCRCGSDRLSEYELAEPEPAPT